MLRENLSTDRWKGSGNFNGPSGLSMRHRSFSRKATRKKAYMIVMITKNIRGGGMRKDKRMFKGERRINSQSTKSRVVRSCELKVES